MRTLRHVKWEHLGWRAYDCIVRVGRLITYLSPIMDRSISWSASIGQLTSKIQVHSVWSGWSLNWHTLLTPPNLVWSGWSSNRHTLPIPHTRFGLDEALIDIPRRHYTTWFGLDEALTGIPCRYHQDLVQSGWSLNRHTLPIPPRLGLVWMKP